MENLSLTKLNEIGGYVLSQTDVRPADIGFVFGTRHGVDEFVLEITRCWWLSLFSKIVVAGGITPGDDRSEAQVIGERLIELGIPAEDILLEQESTNTGENVQYALPIIDKEIGLSRIQSVLAIGKISASRRYLMTLERHWPRPVKMLHPVNYHGVPPQLWYEDPEFKRRVITEWKKIPTYVGKGFLAEIDVR